MKKLFLAYDSWCLKIFDGMSDDLQASGIHYPLLMIIVCGVCAALGLMASGNLVWRNPTGNSYLQFLMLFSLYAYSGWSFIPFYWEAYKRWNLLNWKLCSGTALGVREKGSKGLRLGLHIMIIVAVIGNIFLTGPVDVSAISRAAQGFLAFFSTFLFHMFGCTPPRFPSTEVQRSRKKADQAQQPVGNVVSR